MSVLGPPGSGKGTQAELAGQRFGIACFSTGDLLRKAVREESALGGQVKALLEAGSLVPDDLMGKVVEEKLRRLEPPGSMILDGFPRTCPQVEILDRILERLDRKLHLALALEVPDPEILRRLSGRRVCRSCRATFHVEFQVPRLAGKCDGCGKDLSIRKDDRESVIQNRLRIYRSETTPVLELYRERGLLKEVQADGAVGDVAKRFQKEILQACA
ncbi:MAG: nucleoside monophosphate kinase [Acidobacteriota bacterium]